MAWLYLVLAGICEIGWPVGLKLGWTEFCPMANIETSRNLQLRPFAKSSDRRLKIMVCRLNSQIIAAIGALLFMCSGSVAAAHPVALHSH